MKKKKNKKKISKYNKNIMKKIIVLCLIIVSIIVGLFFGNRYLLSKNDVLYTLVYDDMGEPGSESEIKVYNDRVEIITTHFCSALDCASTTEEETFKYSKDNQKKLKRFFKKNFSKRNIKISHNELTDEQYEVIQGILLGEYFFEIGVEDYKYKLEYSKDDNLSYIVYFKDNKSILVKKLKINDYDIIEIDTYSLKFSKKNLKILNNYIEEEVKEENDSIVYKNSVLRKEEVNIFKSIEENDESYLDKIEDTAKLSYTISYNGINCPTPILYLYSDNTYEYYYTFSTGNEKLVPKVGTYNYDMSKIINNIDKYEENDFGPYSIKTDEKEYTTYNTNIELQEFLSILDVTLEKCLEQQ